jgi:hypothetical protein
MIVGAQKAGTTALSQFLAQHPAVAIAQGKEVHLFADQEVVESWGSEKINHFYCSFFPGVDANLVWGEATPIYLYWPPIIPALKKYNPALKVIVLLRDPIERAISHYQMEKVRKKEWLPLWAALLLEPMRLALAGQKLTHAHKCYSYIARGLYVQQLERLREHFVDDQILIIENTELRQYHAQTLQRVCEFLSLEFHDISPALVFEGEYSQRGHWGMRVLVRPFLRWRFRKANRNLKKLLTDMGVKCEWPWITAE